jgi:hypothetical protein
MITLRVKGLPLTREPSTVDAEGFAVFELSHDRVDWAESCNRAREQIFPGMALPAVDRVFDRIMAARAQRAKVAA